MPFNLKATPNQDRNSHLFALFKPLNDLPADQRVQRAAEIYKNNFRHLSEPVVMSVLDSLQLQAQEQEDRPLECSIYVLRADYYSVNRGYNSLSIDYHQKAIDFAIAHDMPIETAIYLHKKGLYYHTFNHRIEACQYFLQAYDKFKEIGFSNIPNISRYIAEQAQFYYAMKDYETARMMLKQALSYPIANIRIRINLNTAIGLIYRNTNQYHEALKYFNKAAQIAQAHHDSIWIAISKGNIGSVYFQHGDYEKAIPYLTNDYQTSLKYKEYTNAANALLRLTHIDLQYNRLNIAAARLDTVANWLKDNKEDILNISIEFYKQKAGLAEKMGDYKSAVGYDHQYEVLKDSSIRRDNIIVIERLKLKWESEKYHDQLSQFKTNANVDAFKRNAIIFILFLLMVIFVLIFTRYRLNAKREQEMLLIRKRRVDEKLKNAAESLQQYTENIKQNNTLIEKFKAEIDRYKAESNDRTGAEHLEKLMQAHIMTDDNWNDFKRLFTKVHAGFFANLRSSYPHLTDTDMRLLALVKLGLNNREMANMLGITVEGIKKSKQRLRKKMQLGADVDIEHTIAGI